MTVTVSCGSRPLEERGREEGADTGGPGRVSQGGSPRARAGLPGLKVLATRGRGPSQKTGSVVSVSKPGRRRCCRGHSTPVG